MQLNKSHTSEIDCHGKEEEFSVPPQKITCESFHLTQSDEAETTVSQCPAAEYKVHLQQGWNSLCSWHEIQCSLLWRFISTGREKHTFFSGERACWKEDTGQHSLTFGLVHGSLLLALSVLKLLCTTGMEPTSDQAQNLAGYKCQQLTFLWPLEKRREGGNLELYKFT